MGIQCEDAKMSELLSLDHGKVPNDELREELEKRCHISHVTQIRQATMVRVTFEKSLRVQSSGVRMLDGDQYTLRVKYELNAENAPAGLRLKHWNGGFAEYTIEKVLCPEQDTIDMDLEFSARDENGQEIRDSEAHVPMRTQIVDEEGTVFAQIDWNTGINDVFD